MPIHAVHEDYGLIETEPGHYCKSYRIGDNNFLTLPDDEQQIDYKQWKRLLNTITPDMELMVTINNRTVDTAYTEQVLIREPGDAYDGLRKQLNDIIRARITDGKNGIIKEKYLTIGVHAAPPGRQPTSSGGSTRRSPPCWRKCRRRSLLFRLPNGWIFCTGSITGTRRI